MNNREVCEHFVKQDRSSGRGHNLRFEGNVLYSYRTEIARIIGDTIYYSSHSMSNTTGRHLSHLWRAYHDHWFGNTIPVGYERGDEFLSDDQMLQMVYQNMAGTLIMYLLTPRYYLRLERGRSRAYEDLLEFAAFDRHLRQKYYPRLPKSEKFKAAINKALKVTKANRRKWRKNVDMRTQVMLLFRHRIELDGSYLPMVDRNEQSIRGMMSRLQKKSLEELSEAYREIEDPGYEHPKNRTEDWVRNRCRALRRVLQSYSTVSGYMRPFRVIGSKNVIFDGRARPNGSHEPSIMLPAALFRVLKRGADANRHTTVMIHDTEQAYTGVWDPHYESYVRVGGLRIDIEVFNVICKLLERRAFERQVSEA